LRQPTPRACPRLKSQSTQVPTIACANAARFRTEHLFNTSNLNAKSDRLQTCPRELSLHDDFAKHGPAVIERVREARPEIYLKVIASISTERTSFQERKRTSPALWRRLMGFHP